MCHQRIPKDVEWATRNATREDLDAITSLAIEAMPADPQWPYRFPGAKDHPEDHRRFTRLRYDNYMQSMENNACRIMLAYDQNDLTKAALAMAIFQLPGTHVENKKAMVPLVEEPGRRDANPQHVQAFRNAIALSKKKLLDDRVGDRQLMLVSLSTHPIARRRGAGRKLVKWGQKLSSASSVAMTLFASPMGQSLYSSMGFREVGRCHVGVPGDDVELDIPGMIWWPNNMADEGEEKVDEG